MRQRRCHDAAIERNERLLADGVSIALLLVIESLKVVLDLEPDHRGRLVGQVVLAVVGVHGGRKAAGQYRW